MILLSLMVSEEYVESWVIGPPIHTTNKFGRRFKTDLERDNIRSFRLKVDKIRTWKIMAERNTNSSVATKHFVQLITGK